MDVRKKLVEQKIKGGGESICYKCFHNKVCKAMDNQPCIECNQFVDANGVTVLPCNVGDKIYFINRYTNKVDEDIVKYLTITKNGVKPILTSHNIKFWDFYELGKTAFLTKDEAEATLPRPPKGE